MHRSAPFLLFATMAVCSLILASAPLSASRSIPRAPSASTCTTPTTSPRLREVNMPPADFIVVPTMTQQWMINGQVAPALTLTRGHTYTFDLTAFGDEHPFLINGTAAHAFGPYQLSPTYGTVVSFTPTNAMPSMLHYHCSVHSGMQGTITLIPAPACAGDLNNDLLVNSTDFGLFVAAFGTTCASCKADVNTDGVVNSTDFGLFVGAFGSTCM